MQQGILTTRELEVLSLLGDGLTNSEIAGALSTSPDTAETHVASVLGELGVATRYEAGKAYRKSVPTITSSG